MDKNKINKLLEEAQKDIKNGCDVGEIFNDLESDLICLFKSKEGKNDKKSKN